MCSHSHHLLLLLLLWVHSNTHLCGCHHRRYCCWGLLRIPKKIHERIASSDSATALHTAKKIHQRLCLNLWLLWLDLHLRLRIRRSTYVSTTQQICQRLLRHGCRLGLGGLPVLLS